ncbi:MAG: DNA-processing protein DprA [Candidatus Paceibacterota bacterium]|jgi:DNA processing protein
MKTFIIPPEQYPKLVKQMILQPELLEYAGAFPPGDDYKYLCVVGARNYSEYGKNVCEHLISGLKNYPVVIVSGLALGIDSIAHESALDNGLKTISIPGSGLSRKVIYPASHLRLAERIVESGNTLLSPFEHEQEGSKWTFPVRNQLMASISHAVLIIEGRHGSGTFLTAKYALELGRDIMIVPGSIFSDLSYCPHKLYHEGAIPVASSEDILEALGFDIENNKERLHQQQQSELFTESSELLLSPEEKLIITKLQYAPSSATDLLEKISISSSRFNILASELELRGLIKEKDGIYSFRRQTN